MSHVERALHLVAERERELRALLPEPDRAGRLARDAAALATRHEGDRPPLFGALLVVKDVFRVDGFETRCGSALPAELFAGPQASCVSRLLDAGCLVLGKSVTAELACLDPGATANPRDPERTPGGSSSGSGAAVGAGYAPLALGTQTVGSIVRPAAYCGVVGYKPSHGRVPADGVLPYAPSVDCPGLLTADLAWLARAAPVLVPDWRAAAPLGRAPRLGVPDGPYLEQTEPAAREVFERSLADLAARGAAIERVPCFDDWDELVATNLALTDAEMASAHAEWFDEYAPLLRPTVATVVTRGRRVSAERLDACRRARLDLRARLEGELESRGLDAWISPAATGPAPIGLRATGSPAMNMPWTFAGLPVIAVPSGEVDGMPLGLQLAGRFGGDEGLLAAALATSA